MKFLFVMFSALIPAFSQAAVFEGRCTVLQQPTPTKPAKLLVNKQVSLSDGHIETIYDDGRVKYQVSISEVGSPAIHTLQTTITYGASSFLGSAIASYDDKTLNSGGFISVGVNLPGFLTFGCGNR